MSSRPKRPSTPDGLGSRGQKLWIATMAVRSLGPADRVLLEESCRIADRLDVLDAVLRAEFSTSVFAEARQQANVLRQLIVTLGISRSVPARVGGSVLDDLAARRFARGAESADPVEPAAR